MNKILESSLILTDAFALASAALDHVLVSTLTPKKICGSINPISWMNSQHKEVVSTGIFCVRKNRILVHFKSEATY